MHTQHNSTETGNQSTNSSIKSKDKKRSLMIIASDYEASIKEW